MSTRLKAKQSMARYALRFPKPNPKQVLFFKARRKYIAFGGARGGGKSWAIRIKAIMLSLRYPGIIIMIIRKTYPELRANHIDPMRKLIPKWVARYNATEKEFRWFNGSKILFRYCKSEKDLDTYQGTEADIIFIDEATQHLEKVFKVFVACLRGVNKFPKRVYLTCNPGGIGHGWVKRLFVKRQFFPDEDPDEYEFIQSKVTDNAALMQSQPDYIKQLRALPPKLRKAWMDGDWDIFEGQFFEEFIDDPAHYDDQLWTHVINPFPIPKSWPIYRSFDWGYAKPFSCGWWALSPDGTLYRILELYGCKPGEPNEGVKWDKHAVFKAIRDIELSHPYLKGKKVQGVADPSIWKVDGGVSVADTAASLDVHFEKGDNTRIAGWMQVHYRMAFDEDGRSKLYCFNTCPAFIRTMPLQVFDEHIPEDLDSEGEDHCPDEVRYMCMRHPVPPRGSTRKFVPEDDPLNLYVDHTNARDEYQFYRY